jgi:acyl-CoA dehydrogenase
VPRPRPSEQGLWNFFLPNAETGEGLSNLDYAYIAVELGKNRARLGVPELLGARHRQHGGARARRHARAEGAVAGAAARGEIRSAYAMTEPGVASSDAKQHP